MAEPPRILNVCTEDVEIGRLIPHPKNVNQGDFGAIEASIRSNGFHGSVTVQIGTCHILAGNHRVFVAKKLGYRTIPVTWVDCDDGTALRIMLADNRTARLGNDNPAALADLLKELAGTDVGLSGSGYDGDFLDDLLGDLKRPADFSGLGAPKASPEKVRPDRIEREKTPRIPHEADGDRQPGDDDDRGEKTRLGVVIMCDSEDEQDHVYSRNVELGWCPSKTRFSEQSYTRLRGEQP